MGRQQSEKQLQGLKVEWEGHQLVLMWRMVDLLLEIDFHLN